MTGGKAESSCIPFSLLLQNVNVQGLAILSGGNVLGRWSHIFSSRRDITLQLYFDNYDRDGPESDDLRNTFDLDFQNHIFLNARQDLIWGLGYRHIADQTAGTIDQAFFRPTLRVISSTYSYKIK